MLTPLASLSFLERVQNIFVMINFWRYQLLKLFQNYARTTRFRLSVKPTL